MSSQIILAWTVDAANTILTASGAATKLGAVKLYDNTNTDPILGQFMGLTVADDETVAADEPGTTATRTLTLNMNSSQGDPTAPPPFPCNPTTAVPPTLPYSLRRAITLPGSFFLTMGSTAVETSASQMPSLANGDSVQFLDQKGVFYTVASVSPTAIVLTAPYSGASVNTTAFKEVAAPVPLDRAAVYSSSDLDTGGVATEPAIPAGVGARTVELIYNDSTGAGPFVAEATLTGKRPATFVFDEPSGMDIAEIVNMLVDDTGAFTNSVGEITLVELSEALPAVLSNRTPEDFVALTDEAQILIDRAVAYLPPSYFALSDQSASQGASPAPPSNAKLSVLLGQFVALETAGPPPAPPLSPATVPAPTVLSGQFTKTIQLALAGVPVVSATITFA